MVFTSDEKFLSAIEKAIRKHDPNLIPTKEDECSLKVPVPRGSDSQKQALLKSAKDLAERMRHKIRDIRADARSDLKKKGNSKSGSGLSKDDVRKWEQVIQKQTDDFIKKIDTKLAEKSKEIEKL